VPTTPVASMAGTEADAGAIDAELYRAISEGKRRDGEPPFMPWWGYTLTAEDIWNLVAFIRSLAKDVSKGGEHAP
jgi:mono/diheme cytochrome c family protein